MVISSPHSSLTTSARSVIFTLALRQLPSAVLCSIPGISFTCPQLYYHPTLLSFVCNCLRIESDLFLPNWFYGEKPPPFSNNKLKLASFAVTIGRLKQGTGVKLFPFLSPPFGKCTKITLIHLSPAWFN